MAAVPAAAPAAAVVKSATSAGLACAAVGFVSAHAAVSYGYGLAIAWHARAALRSATTPVAVRVLLAYGLKVTAYQALRDREKHYRDAVLPLFQALEKDTKCPFTRTTHKIPLVAGVACLLALYAAPIRLLANAPRPRVTVFAGAAAASSCSSGVSGSVRGVRAARGESGPRLGTLGQAQRISKCHARRGGLRREATTYSSGRS